jgi:hypothetical protein
VSEARFPDRLLHFWATPAAREKVSPCADICQCKPDYFDTLSHPLFLTCSKSAASNPGALAFSLHRLAVCKEMKKARVIGPNTSSYANS